MKANTVLNAIASVGVVALCPWLSAGTAMADYHIHAANKDAANGDCREWISLQPVHETYQCIDTDPGHPTMSAEYEVAVLDTSSGHPVDAAPVWDYPNPEPPNAVPTGSGR
ncbi:hypothetical protein [Nocardia sp. CDC160]|uniref:hypothetical protein n=1 Tax=Nocardia sp. CDC160 TaxID=3112166 RepID=UPI002DB5815C|nr:hypothetical protein [Nocardia sp. CDC160]MEC3919277.1 hypothetical protein [Nocardia sp. CDC160]